MEGGVLNASRGKRQPTGRRWGLVSQEERRADDQNPPPRHPQEQLHLKRSELRFVLQQGSILQRKVLVGDLAT